MSGPVGGILGVLLLVAVLLSGLYVWGALSWAYSEGERARIRQKFSIKGWVCKTYERELAISIVPGVTPVIWTFSVRDKSLAPQINAAPGKRVVLHYREHRGLPTTYFGEIRDRRPRRGVRFAPQGLPEWQRTGALPVLRTRRAAAGEHARVIRSVRTCRP